MAVTPVTCRQLVELVTDYLENALTPRWMAAVTRHLAGCDDCDAFVAQLRLVIVLNRRALVRADRSLAPRRLDSIRASFRQATTPR